MKTTLHMTKTSFLLKQAKALMLSAAIGLVAGQLVITPVTAQEDTVVAKVGESTITKGELDQALVFVLELVL